MCYICARELIDHFVRTEELYRPLYGGCVSVHQEILYAAVATVSGPYTCTRTRAQYTG